MKLSMPKKLQMSAKLERSMILEKPLEPESIKSESLHAYEIVLIVYETIKAYGTTKDYDCIYDGLVLYCRVQATGWSGSGSV